MNAPKARRTPVDEALHASRSAVRLGLVALVIGLGALLVWSAWAPLHGAVLAQGVVKASGNRKLVQHTDGGVVARILVRNGDRVVAGQPVLELVDPRIDASLRILQEAQALEAVRRSRLLAQQQGQVTFTSPPLPGVEPRVMREAQAREARILTSRHELLEQQISSHREQLAAVRLEEAGLRRQIDSTRQSAELASEELVIHRRLQDEQFVSRARVLVLERSLAEALSRVAEQEAALMQAAQRRQELMLRLESAPREYQRAAAEELRDSEARLLQLAEQLRPAEDAARRQRVLATATGRVVGLRVNAPGEVVPPREAVMEVVPEDDALVVEARVPLDAIAHLQPPQLAELRFTTFNSRQTPLVSAQMIYVSDDALTDTAGQIHYLIQVAPDADALKRAGIDALRPGMAAEVFVQTASRTLLDYLLAPITDTIRRSMREPN